MTAQHARQRRRIMSLYVLLRGGNHLGVRLGAVERDDRVSALLPMVNARRSA